MAVLIKGMEMPTNCVLCRFRSDGWCYAISEDQWQDGETRQDRRPDWCPLVELRSKRSDNDALLEESGFEL